MKKLTILLVTFLISFSTAYPQESSIIKINDSIFTSIVVKADNSKSFNLSGNLKFDMMKSDTKVIDLNGNTRPTWLQLSGASLILSNAAYSVFLDNDKAKHNLISSFASGVTYVVTFSQSDGNRKLARWVSVGTWALAGVGKEVWDLTVKGTHFSVGDMFITWISGLITTVGSDLLFVKND